MDNLDLVIGNKEFLRIDKTDVETFLRNRDRIEDDVFEFKEDFDRDRGNGKIKIQDLCKNIVGFANTDFGGYIFYGVKDNIKDLSIVYPNYINGISLERNLEELLQGWIKERIHRRLYMPLRFFEVDDKRLLIIKVPAGVNKPYAYFEPSTKAYTYYKRSTSRLDCLRIEEIESFYFETIIKKAHILSSIAELSDKRNSESGDSMGNKISCHQEFILNRLENVKDFGYWCFYCYPDTVIKIDDKRFDETFLNYSKRYSETLLFSDSAETFQSGYLRGYYPKSIKDDIKGTEYVTCYSDGFIALDAQVDFLFDNDNLLNLNALTYFIQRHFQLCKEIFEGYCEEIKYWLDFKYIESFSIPVWSGSYIRKKFDYQGANQPIEGTIKLSNISGRDQWNIIFPEVKEIIKEISRIFGSKDIPDDYWDENGELNYSKGVNSR